jgi:hypothetical protein
MAKRQVATTKARIIMQWNKRCVNPNQPLGVRVQRWIGGLAVVLFLVGCGGTSPAQIQATIDSAVSATAQAQQVATSVAATQVAQEPCGAAKLAAYVATVEPLVGKFERQAGVTSVAPRIGLSVPLQELLNIQNDVIAITPPVCLVDFHAQVVSMMGLYRFAYETFSAQGDEAVVTQAITMGTLALAKVREGLATIHTGQVPATPTPAP